MTRLSRLTAIAGLATLVALVTGSSAFAAQRRAVGDAPRLPHAAHLLGSVSRARRLEVTIGMASRDPLGLQALATAVATPGSAEYGRSLTVRQFARRFGATTASLAAVRHALRADGLRVVKTYANHMSLTASGTAAALQRTFETRLARVRLADGRTTLVNTSAPSLPAPLARRVDAVLGLNGLAVLKPLGVADRARSKATARPDARRRPAARPHIVTGGPQPCAAATAAAAPLSPDVSSIAAFGYTADGLAAAYGLPSLYAAGDFGQGQTIVLYEQESLDPVDVAAFQACYGTAAPVKIASVDGAADPIDTGDDGDGEAALDVDQVIGMAPQASIIVDEASQSDNDGPGKLLSTIASQDAGKIVSISYGGCEANGGKQAARYEARLFNEMAVQGQSVFASSGDQGSEACSPPSSDDSASLAVADPASQPNVTAVGGTSLYSGASAAPTPWNGANDLVEGIWNSGSFIQSGQMVGAATTGGVSANWAMPKFQSQANPALGVVNGFSAGGGCGAAACREVPDVSADGDPTTGTVIYANSEDPDASTDPTTGLPYPGWQTSGGTSASAPLWAAFAAMTNGLPACRGLSIGDINPALYALAGQSYTSYFRDVSAPGAFTSATSNDTTGVNPGIYPVGPGYDLATGLGVPQMGALANGLCATRAPVYTVTVHSPGSVKIVTGVKTKLKISATDSGGAPLTFTATGLPKGLKLDRSTGIIRGTPRKLGTKKVTVSATDFATNTASTQFVLAIVAPRASIGHASLRGLAGRRPHLRFVVAHPRRRRLSSVTVSFSEHSGLAIGRHNHGIQVKTATGKRHRKVGFSTRHRHKHSVTIHFRKAQKKVIVSIGHGTLTAGRKLLHKAGSHVLRLKLTLRATDTKHHTTRRTVKVKAGSEKKPHHRRKKHHG